MFRYVRPRRIHSMLPCAIATARNLRYRRRVQRRIIRSGVADERIFASIGRIFASIGRQLVHVAEDDPQYVLAPVAARHAHLHLGERVSE